MQAAAIVVSLAITIVAIALAARAVGEMVRVVRLGQPAKRSLGPAGPTHRDDAARDARPHPDAQVERGRRSALVRLRRFRAAVLHPGHGLRPAGRRGLRAAADRHWQPFEWSPSSSPGRCWSASRLLIAIRLRSHPARTGRPSRFAGSTMWQGYYVEGTVVGVGRVHPRAARAGVRAGRRRRQSHFPLTFFIGDALGGLSTRDAGEPGLSSWPPSRSSSRWPG